MESNDHIELREDPKYLGRRERESMRVADEGEILHELKKMAPNRWMLKMITGNETTVYFAKTKKEALETVMRFLMRTKGELKIDILWNGGKM